MSSIISGFLSVSLVFGLFFLFLLKNFYQKLLIFFFYFLKNYFIFNFWGMFDPNFFLHPNFALCHNIKKIQIHCYLHLEINNYTPVLNYRCHQQQKKKFKLRGNFSIIKGICYLIKVIFFFCLFKYFILYNFVFDVIIF